MRRTVFRENSRTARRLQRNPWEEIGMEANFWTRTNQRTDVPLWALGVSYVGTHFHGWQRQDGGVTTVQGELERALSQIANQPIVTRCAGRTDRGVHAYGQVVAFESDAERSVQDWMRGGNGLTPDSVSINWVRAMDAAFHPRYSATSRTYRYLFVDAAENDPFLTHRVWQTRRRLTGKWRWSR